MTELIHLQYTINIYAEVYIKTLQLII